MRQTLLLLILTLSVSCALAVPARRVPIAFTQPDGSVIMVVKHGDERAHCYLDQDGAMLLKRGAGLYYANVDAAGALYATEVLATPGAVKPVVDKQALSQAMQAKAQASARSPKRAANAQYQSRAGNYGLYPGSTFPAYGKRYGIVVLVEYQNLGFAIENPNDYVSRMLNQEGFSDNGGTGSARDYFIDNSHGEFQPQFDVYGPVTLPYNYQYYGENNSYGEDMHAEEMVIHACQILDDSVDLSMYDNDGDGQIDFVYIIFPGMGEADGGKEDTVWPHQWTLDEAQPSQSYIFDGVQLNNYACSAELQYNEEPYGIGCFVHEFSHVLGLPDLYDTGTGKSYTPEDYSILDYGMYANDTNTPVGYGIFERSALGWMEPELLLAPESYALQAISKSNHGFYLPTAQDTEYFLFENRQLDGWDAYLPNTGMLVWHIDYNSHAWRNNAVNNTATHQRVDLLEADNIQSYRTIEGDPFPGSYGITELSDATAPSLCAWDGTPSGMALSDIRESNGLITFSVAKTAGIMDITKDAISLEDCIIYSIDGRMLGRDALGLAPGIYVIVSPAGVRSVCRIGR